MDLVSFGNYKGSLVSIKRFQENEERLNKLRTELNKVVTDSNLEYIGRIGQSGTSAPSMQTVFKNSLNVGTLAGGNKINLSFTRAGVGLYTLKLRTVVADATDMSKIHLSFSDGKARVTAITTGQETFSTFGNTNYIEYSFSTYSVLGELEDALLVFTNITLKQLL